MSTLTIVGDPVEGPSLPRLALEVARLLGRWSSVQAMPTMPSHGEVFLALTDRREQAAQIASTDPDRLVTLVHPSAVVSPSATLGRNVMIGAQAVVMMDAVVGDGVVASSLTSIEHDNHIGAMTFLGSGVILCGRVTTGEFAFLGGGSVVKPGVEIGAHCTVGTGAVVIIDTEPHSTVVGNPARSLDR